MGPGGVLSGRRSATATATAAGEALEPSLEEVEIETDDRGGEVLEGLELGAIVEVVVSKGFAQDGHGLSRSLLQMLSGMRCDGLMSGFLIATAIILEPQERHSKDSPHLSSCSCGLVLGRTNSKGRHKSKPTHSNSKLVRRGAEMLAKMQDCLGGSKRARERKFGSTGKMACGSN